MVVVVVVLALELQFMRIKKYINSAVFSVTACGAICYNCADLDVTNCRCSCADGWHGADCSGIC